MVAMARLLLAALWVKTIWRRFVAGGGHINV